MSLLVFQYSDLKVERKIMFDFRFLMVSHTTEDAMCTALGYACGRFIVVICLILISALLMFLLLLFVRSVFFNVLAKQ